MENTCAGAREERQNDVSPAKIQISLGIRPVRSESSLCDILAKAPNFLQADSEDSDQAGRMPGIFCFFVT